MPTPKKVLVIEDERDIAQALVDRFNASGFEAQSSGDGMQGINAARQERPDLIILDVMLPKVDGFKVAKILKFDQKTKGVPIIMLTAKAQSGDKKLGLEAGVDAYFTKPCDMKSLLAKAKELTERSPA